MPRRPNAPFLQCPNAPFPQCRNHYSTTLKSEEPNIFRRLTEEVGEPQTTSRVLCSSANRTYYAIGVPSASYLRNKYLQEVIKHMVSLVNGSID